MYKCLVRNVASTHSEFAEEAPFFYYGLNTGYFMSDNGSDEIENATKNTFTEVT